MEVLRRFFSIRTSATGKCSSGYFPRRGISSHSFVDKEDEVLPVLIVGAGPVGLVLSILLTKLGVKCAVLEKSRTFSKHPQAHFINNRTMEVFRKLDGLAEEIQESQPPVDLWRKFIYCTSLTGPILGSVDHMQPQDFERVVSPVSVAHFSQYKLTALLLKQLESLGFKVHNPEVFDGLTNSPLRGREILMGHECVSVDATGHNVNVTTSFLKGGKVKERDFKCCFLIGADGAGSTVRRLIGVEMKGQRDMQNLVSVHFMSRELGKFLINERPGMLFFIFNTQAIGVLVAHDLKQGEFVLQIPYYPPQQNIEDFSTQMCEKIISKLVGRVLSDVKVNDIKPWVMHAEVAEKYVCCDNQVILAGDAAHRFPPAGGFGMNTGIQDAHNLAWKVASVVMGKAPHSLLHSYETERKPIAMFNTELSIRNFRAAMEVPAALGLDPTIANAVHQVINKGIGSVLPSRLQKALLDAIFSVGRAQLSESLLNEHNPLGTSRLANLRRIFEEGKSLQLQFPAEDLGFRYLEGALIPAGESAAHTRVTPTGRRRDYVPRADPGSRLPHMNMRLLHSLSNKDTLSTLDLVSGEVFEFLLIIAPFKESYDVARAASEVANEFKVSVKICIVWPASRTYGSEVGSKDELAPWKNYVDVQEVKRPTSSSSWWDICQMSDRGAILVRPDEHIGWCAKTRILGNLHCEMENVFSTILGSKANTK